MKKKILYNASLIVLVCIVLSLFGCKSTNSIKDSKLAIINGNIKGIDRGTATISTENMHVVLDSVKIKNGQFKLQVEVDIPNRYFVIITKEGDEGPSILGNVFLAGGNEVYMSAELGVDLSPSISNAPLMDESKLYEEFIKSQKEGKELLKLRYESSEAFKSGDKIKVQELNMRRNQLSVQLIDKILGYRSDSKESPAAAYHVYSYASILPIEDKIRIVESYPTNIDDLLYITKLKTEIESERNVAIGNAAPDFQVQDLEGNEYSLSSFKGKYVFLEFSASWCGWCKLEVPYIRNAYHKFKDKNIVFITMNMDVTRSLWEATVKDDNVEWLCLSNLEGMHTELARSYNISGIPMSFVIDPDGKIIKQGLRGDDIIEYLSPLL